ncbi:MAG: RNA polymerase sigma factor [Tunicatimonas sp.]
MELNQLPDERLLGLFQQQQDHIIFSELVNRHRPYVVKRCFYYLKDQDDAQDVAQEVLIRLLTKSETYRSDAPFMPWLNTIIRNRCVDHLNQDKKELHQEISRKIEETIEEAYDTDEVDKPTVEILEELLEQVDGEEKLLLLLKYRQGWSVQDIQRSLSLNENTVKSKLKRSREKLRKLLTDYRNDQAS